MQAIILCGGRGERLMPMTACTPAGLLRIIGRPVISYALEQLEKAGFTKAALSLGYLGGMVEEAYSDRGDTGMEISFSDSQELGTAAAVKTAAEKGEELLVIEANCVFDFDIGGIIDFHRAKKSYATFVTVSTDAESRPACFAIDNQNRITDLETDASPHSANSQHTFAGVYILSSKVLEDYDFSGFADVISEAVPRMLSDGKKLYVYGETGFWRSITHPEGFIKCQKEILAGSGGFEINAPSAYTGIWSLTEGNFAGVAMESPIYIGKNVTIESGAVIGAGSVIDDNAVIGRRARINGSYVGEAAHIYARCQLFDSVVCAGARLLSSVTCGEHSVCGEKSRIGESSRIADGARVWAGKEVMPNSAVSGSVLSGMARSAYIDEESCFHFMNASNAPQEAVCIGMAAGSAFDVGSSAAVGYSGGAASKALCHAFMSGLSACGVSVMYLGECVPQQVTYGISRLSCSLGCFVTSESSGRIKLTDRGGLPLVRTKEREIEQALSSDRYRSLEYHGYTPIAVMSGLSRLYQEYLSAMLPPRFSGVNAEIRTSSAVTARIADELFRSRNDIDGERIVFHISPDGAACSAYSDKSGYVFHERLVLLGMKSAYKNKIPVAVPFVFPMAADTVAEAEGGILYRYYSSSDGGSDSEARRTAQRPDNFFVRDGSALACTISGYLSENGLSLSEALEDIPEFYSSQRYVSVSGRPSRLLGAFTEGSAVSGDGVVIENRSSRAVVRPVRGGGGLMIFAESFKTEAATAMCDEIQEKLRLMESKTDGV